MIGAAMPPKSPALAASVCETVLRAVISSTIMLGSAARTGAFTAAATHKSKGVSGRSRDAYFVARGGSCRRRVHVHAYV